MKKENLQYLGFDDTLLMLIGIPFLTFVVPWLFLGMSMQGAWACFAAAWPGSLVSTSLFWLGDRRIIILFRRKFTSVNDSRKRIAIGYSVIAVYTVLISLLLFWLLQFAPENSGNPYQDAPLLLSIASSLFVTSAVSAVYEATYYLHQWKQSIATTEKLKKEHVTSQLEALKNQVNPHFLFNSLNTLTAIIPEDPVKAVEFVQNLSHVYRCILDLRDQKEITVEEELQCLEKYAFLVQTRFGDNLQLDIQVGAKDLKRFVVPLCLQVLTENAIKHNVVSSKSPLVVHYFVENNRLVVSNAMQRKEQEMGNTGTGLRNIRNRYLLTFDCEPVVLQNEKEFRVELPLIDIDEYESTHH